MSLIKLKTAPFLLITDDASKNIIPILQELVTDKSYINLFSYEHPVATWKEVFRNSNISFFKEFQAESHNKYTSTKCTIIVDSVNQMSLEMGLNKCINCLKRLSHDKHVENIILILHKDCLPHSSKLQTYLNHMASAVLSYDFVDCSKISITIKKGNKVIKSEERVYYDSQTKTLKSIPILKQTNTEEPEKPSPGTLTTFKIEVDQLDKMEKSKLKLPYMSKINEGESKVFYEPDAVDDWDEEDPDEDLDI